MVCGRLTSCIATTAVALNRCFPLDTIGLSLTRSDCRERAELRDEDEPHLRVELSGRLPLSAGTGSASRHAVGTE